jgi:hypothetical protein
MTRNPFIPTVTIALEDYEQLKRDAAQVRNHYDDARHVIIDAMCRLSGFSSSKEPGATIHDMHRYWTYVTRCLLRGETPQAMEDWVLSPQESKP